MMHRLVLGSILVTLSLFSFTPALAQDPPATTFQPGPWQPVDRLDPARPVIVVIVNQTGALLEYGTTDPSEAVLELENGAISQLTVATLPAFITINTLERSALKYTLSTDLLANVVQVTVTKINDVVGDRTLNIDDTGAIYIY